MFHEMCHAGFRWLWHFAFHRWERLRQWSRLEEAKQTWRQACSMDAGLFPKPVLFLYFLRQEGLPAHVQGRKGGGSRAGVERTSMKKLCKAVVRPATRREDVFELETD
jgi:hypothetical protein